MSQVWLITGSGHGLGRSIAEAALAAGGRVLATARDTGRLADLVAKHGDRVRTFALDVTDQTAAQAAVDFAVQEFGRLDVLVNNAGFGHIAPFEQMTDADFRAQIDTNLYGVVNVTRAAIPVMRGQRSGHIINISSIGGRVGMAGVSAYQAAKWAVSGFTEVLAQEVASFGVKVIAVEPGGMRTEWGFVAGSKVPPLLADYEQSVGAMVGLMKGYAGREIGDPEKVAAVVADLARRDALPPHLILGSDALQIFAQVDAARQQALKEWEPVSRSIDIGGVDLSFLSQAAE